MRSKLHLDAGTFRTLISLFVNETISDGCGGVTDIWQAAGIAWACIQPAKTSSQISGDQLINLQNHIVDVRQPLAVVIGAQLRVEGATRVFEILAVSDPDETGRYWRCECRELVS